LTKQISIWFFEHNKRITIIEYHGGTILYSAMPIIKIAILSSILSSIVTIIFAINIKNNLGVILSPEILNIISSINTININYFQVISLSLGISLISILGVLVKHSLTKIGR
jgi:cell division transport system permease protein